MAFIKSIFFVAFIAAVSAQLGGFDIGQLMPSQNSTPVNGEQLGQVPVAGEQLGQLMPSTTEAAAGETSAPAEAEASRLTEALDRVANGLNAMRGSGRRH